MKKFIQYHWPIIILVFLSGFIIWPLFLPGFFPTQDEIQVMRIYEMRKCLEDIQIPCRWTPDLAFGYGYPLFNYYNPFPYYIGAIISYIFGFVISTKILFLIPLVLGGVSMHLLAKELYGRTGGFIAGVLYLFAPYRAVDAYVRGAVTESFSLAIIPLVFYSSVRLIRQGSLKNLISMTVFLCMFLLSHNIMNTFFVPLLFIWICFFFYIEGIKNLKFVLISLALAFSLSAFFIIPAYFEKNLIQIENMVDDITGHAPSLGQLFLNRFWGYGSSIRWSSQDGMSFQIGWPHWWLIGLVLSVSLVKFTKTIFLKKQKQFKTITPYLLLLLLVIIFTYSVFMMLKESAFIWQKLEILEFTQFSWRYLSVTIFFSSLLGGMIVLFIKGKVRIAAVVLIIVLTIVLNWQFFRPVKIDPLLNDKTMLSGPKWDEQRSSSFRDYLPRQAKVSKLFAPEKPQIVSGKAEINTFVNNSNRFKFNIKVYEYSTLDIPVFDFPKWEIRVNQKIYQHKNNQLGLIELSLSPGNYNIVGTFHNTLIRTASNLVSLASVAILLLIFTKIIKI